MLIKAHDLSATVCPTGWVRSRLADMLQESSIRAGDVHSFPVLSVTKHKGIVRADEYFAKAVHGRDTSNYKVVHPGEFAYATIHLDEGSIGRLNGSAPGIVSPMYTVFGAKIEIDPYYFETLLRSPQSIATYGALAQGTVNRRASISFSAFSGLILQRPPLPEQKKIAAVLSSVDAAIEKTEAVIAQLQVVKKAMMEQLLTKGMPGRHTRFKQTDLGEIPEDWEVVLLDSVAKRGSGHTPDKEHPEYWDGTIKWVSLKDSSKLDRLHISNTAAMITEQGIANSSAVEHPAGTVVLLRDASVGRSAIITDTMAVSQHFMAWHCGPRLNNYFLYYWLQRQKPMFEHIAIGSTIKTIGLPFFKKLQLQLPLLEEQQQIASCLTSIDFLIFDEQRVLAEFKHLKSSLSSSLLSGELRVPTDSVPCPV